MFQQNSLAKLYPHLQFGRVAPPSVRASITPNPMRSTSVHSNRSVVSEKSEPEKPKTPIVEPAPVHVKEPEPPKKVEKVKKVKVVAPPPSPVTPIEPPKQEEVKPVVESKPVQKRPNRVKPEPKPEPKRESVIPQKGEQGLQRKYTAEQRKQIYLDRLSRKSIKNAEREIAKVNEVLEAVEHDPKRLEQVEKEVKNKLKLINYAKYFANVENDFSNRNSINEPTKIDTTTKSDKQGDVIIQGDKPTTSRRGRIREKREERVENRPPDPSPTRERESESESGSSSDDGGSTVCGSESG